MEEKTVSANIKISTNIIILVIVLVLSGYVYSLVNEIKTLKSAIEINSGAIARIQTDVNTVKYSEVSMLATLQVNWSIDFSKLLDAVEYSKSRPEVVTKYFSTVETLIK